MQTQPQQRRSRGQHSPVFDAALLVKLVVHDVGPNIVWVFVVWVWSRAAENAKHFLRREGRCEHRRAGGWVGGMERLGRVGDFICAGPRD